MNQSEKERLAQKVNELSRRADIFSRELERVSLQLGLPLSHLGRPQAGENLKLEVVARRVVSLMFEEHAEWGDLKAAVAEMGVLLDKMT